AIALLKGGDNIALVLKEYSRLISAKLETMTRKYFSTEELEHLAIYSYGSNSREESTFNTDIDFMIVYDSARFSREELKNRYRQINQDLVSFGLIMQDEAGMIIIDT
ncbi:MAG: DUF294 nucleotidyltransferase-like domain-containing protein, partial [Candidatus Margulisiibacteriota bacterium]